MTAFHLPLRRADRSKSSQPVTESSSWICLRPVGLDMYVVHEVPRMGTTDRPLYEDPGCCVPARSRRVGAISITVANERSILPARDDVNGGYLMIKGTRMPPSDENDLKSLIGAIAADAQR